MSKSVAFETEEERLRRHWKRQTFGLFSAYLRNCTQESGLVKCDVKGTTYSLILRNIVLLQVKFLIG